MFSIDLSFFLREFFFFRLEIVELATEIKKAHTEESGTSPMIESYLAGQMYPCSPLEIGSPSGEDLNNPKRHDDGADRKPVLSLVCS